MRSRSRCWLPLLIAAGLGASEDALTALPATLQMRRSLKPTANQPGMFVGTIELRGGSGLEVIGGDGVLLAAVDSAGASLINPDYIFDGTQERAPLFAHSIGFAAPADEARQHENGPQFSLYFLPRGADTVIAHLRIRATVVLGDASRRVATLGAWPAVIGPHPDLPGDPVVAADADGQLELSLDAAGKAAWRTFWLEVDGKPLASSGGGARDRDRRYVATRNGRVPDGAVLKAELTRIRGESTIEFAVGPWAFPGRSPPPQAVRVPLEVPDAR